VTSILSSGVVEVAVCLAFVYLLLSLLCSVVNEWIAGILGSRAANLEKGIQSLFTDGKLAKDGPSIAAALYDHGLIQSLYTESGWDKILARFGRKVGPSYIAPQLFATTLVNLLMSPVEALRTAINSLPEGDVKQALLPLLPAPGAAANSLEALRAAINNLPEGDVKQALLPLLPAPGAAANPVEALRAAIDSLPPSKGQQALAALVNQGQTDLEQVRKTLEGWYNDGMDRVAGWYKRRTTLVLFFLGLITAFATNTDSFLLGRVLWNNPTLRQATVDAADKYIQSQQPDTSQTTKTTDKGQPNATPAKSTAATDNSQAGATPPKTGIDATQVKKSIEDLNTQLQKLQLPVGWPTMTPQPTSPLDAVMRGFKALGYGLKTLFFEGEAPQQCQDQEQDTRAFPTDTGQAWFRVFGWLFTAAALSLGAPFWFDVLNKFMVVRSTVKPKEKSQPEASKDK
jgi:hypothetical protein